MKDTRDTPRQGLARSFSSPWILNAMSAVGGLLLLGYAIFDVIPDPDRNPYWRVTCGVFAPFLAYTVYSYAKDAVRMRRNARGRR